MTWIRMRTILLIHLLILLPWIQASSQDFVTVAGRVVDEKTREPLPYASIVIRNTTIGTMANAEGRFVFHVPATHTEGTLQIYMLGYATKELLIKSMRSEEMIELKNNPTILKEVVVRDLSPKEILKRASRYKRKNYPTQPFQFEGYYREVQRADGKNVSLHEAFVLIEDNGYHETKEQKFYLKQIRLAESYSNPVAPFWNNKNLLMAFLNQNFVKYSRTFNHYKVVRKADTAIDGVLVYVLEVNKRYALWPSLIYIRADNYAIIRTEENFSVERYGPRRWKVDDNPMMESFPQAKTLQINYKLVNGKYYPENYRMYFKTIFKDAIQKKEVLTFEISQQFVATRLFIDDLQIADQDNALNAKISLKAVALPTDTTFWKYSPIRDTPVDSLIRMEFVPDKDF